MRVWWGSVRIIGAEIVSVGFVSVGIIGSIGIINRSRNQFQPQVLNRGRSQSTSYGQLPLDRVRWINNKFNYSWVESAVLVMHFRFAGSGHVPFWRDPFLLFCDEL